MEFFLVLLEDFSGYGAGGGLVEGGSENRELIAEPRMWVREGEAKGLGV